MLVCKCFAFLTYFILLFFYVGTSCLVLFISLSASFFSRGLRPHLHAFCKKAWQKLLCFLLSMFFISPCVSNPQNKMLVCKCFAFLTYFILLFFYVGTSCLVLFISLSASFFSRGLRPHLHAFCKKAWQKLLCFLLSMFFISPCVSNPQNKMLVCKCFAFLTYFILLSLFYVGTACLVLFISLCASLFSCGLRPHPHAF